MFTRKAGKQGVGKQRGKHEKRSLPMVAKMKLPRLVAKEADKSGQEADTEKPVRKIWLAPWLARYEASKFPELTKRFPRKSRFALQRFAVGSHPIEHIGNVTKTVQDVTSRAALDKARARNRRVLQRALQQKRHIELLASAMQSQRKSAKSQHCPDGHSMGLVIRWPLA